MGDQNTKPRMINGVEGAAGQAMLSGGPGILETWGAPAPAVHGADKHTDVERELFIPANEGYVEAGTPGQTQGYAEVEGAANVGEPRVYFTIKVPDDFVSFVSVKAVWLSPAAAGNMYWRITTTGYAAAGEVYTTHSDVPAFGVTATGGFNIINVQEPENPLTLVNLALGDYLGLFFYRDGTNALDTLDDVAKLYGLLFTYVAEQ